MLHKVQLSDFASFSQILEVGNTRSLLHKFLPSSQSAGTKDLKTEEHPLIFMFPNGYMTAHMYPISQRKGQIQILDKHIQFPMPSP